MATPSYKDLLARLEDQQARIDRLEAAAAGAHPDADSQRTTRRGMVKTAAAGAAGFAGALLVEPGIASASAPASFTSTTSTPAVTAANNSGKGPSIVTHAKGGVALKGTQAANGAGVVAVQGQITAASGAGTGVAGISPLGSGVSGTSDTGTGVQGQITDPNGTGTGTGVAGTSPGGTGVSGTSASGVGVAGTVTGQSGGIGVQGQITGPDGTGTGVAGHSPWGTGVAGTSDTGIAVSGTTPSTASGATAVEGLVSSTSPGGYSAGVYGQNNGTGGSGIGVYGAQNGFGWGVYGTTPSGSGVYGYSTSGYGVQAGSNSGTGAYVSSTGGVGLDGHSSTNNAVQGTSGSGIGVQGSSSSNTGVQGSSSSGYGVYGSSPNNYAVVGVTTSGNGVYGQVSTANQAGLVGRQEAAGGNWAMYGFGNIGATGTKSAVVPAADGKGHMTLYCMESPECWFEDFGSAKLANGSVRVKLDPEFAQTIETGKYHVFLQAEGECKGLSVGSRSKTGFVVQELAGGSSNVRFAFRIVALRKDVAAPRLARVSLPEVPHVELRVAQSAGRAAGVQPAPDLREVHAEGA